MPRFEISAGENDIDVELELVGDDHTQRFPPLRFGMGVSIAAGSPADADTISVVCTGANGHAPAFTVIADEDGLTFTVYPAPPSGPATIGPLSQGDSDSIPAGADGTSSYTVTISR